MALVVKRRRRDKVVWPSGEEGEMRLLITSRACHVSCHTPLTKTSHFITPTDHDFERKTDCQQIYQKAKVSGLWKTMYDHFFWIKEFEVHQSTPWRVAFLSLFSVWKYSQALYLFLDILPLPELYHLTDVLESLLQTNRLTLTRLTWRSCELNSSRRY